MRITVKHDVPCFPGMKNLCFYPGGFDGDTMCPYRKYRVQTHGRKAPAERKPKCTLFDKWLVGDLKCEACINACKEAENDGLLYNE